MTTEEQGEQLHNMTFNMLTLTQTGLVNRHGTSPANDAIVWDFPANDAIVWDFPIQRCNCVGLPQPMMQLCGNSPANDAIVWDSPSPVCNSPHATCITRVSSPMTTSAGVSVLDSGGISTEVCLDTAPSSSLPTVPPGVLSTVPPGVLPTVEWRKYAGVYVGAG